MSKFTTKKERMEDKSNYPSFYKMVARVPNEKDKKTYTRLVSSIKANVLVNGRLKLDIYGNPYLHKLTREYKYV